MADWSWGTWTDVLVDFGRELYVPWQLAQGKVLYRDIAHFNGPLSSYVNALWFRLFGVSLRTIVLCNIAIIGLFLGLCYDVLRRIGGKLSAACACIVFVTVFAFGQLVKNGNYNFVCPYSHELTHGIVVSFAAIWFVVRFGSIRPAIATAGAGLCLGVVFLTKPEVFLPAALAVAGGLLLTWRVDNVSPGRLSGRLVTLLGFVVLPVSTAVFHFSRAMPLSLAIRGACGAWPWVIRGDVGSLAFYRIGMGTDDVRRSIVAMLPGIGEYAAGVIVIAGSGLVARTPAGRRLARLGASLAAIVLIAAATRAEPARWFTARVPGAWFHVARPLPVVMLALAAGVTAMLAVGRPSRDDRLRSIAQLSLIAFALGLLGKIVLNTRVYNYGFALAMPATLVAVVGLVDWLPGWLRRRGGDATVCRIASLGLLVAGVVVNLQVVRSWFLGKIVPVGKGADIFLADDRGPVVNEALEVIEREVPPGGSLTAIPDGAMLNYLSRRIDRIPYLAFNAPGLTMFGEERVLASLSADPPDFIALVHRDPYEFGFFGREYGRPIYAWVRDHYRPVALVGAPPLLDDRFGIALLRRENAS